ncbi:DUF6233 domain-containing protein [Streptomyces sp. NBC_00199]|uniref:DUF6233 domain-containing protein n=1 Tax=Streptomyces sp. NBC_00199 TaxID=2975678 RepID=UPI00225BCF9D|nr:DUF6233 domain-containing protein [Streptomyces sp. NBC_00199]MCX5265708.1 DUF6233 domain-containing protein [Streptomyces sp. NBC_00199]
MWPGSARAASGRPARHAAGKRRRPVDRDEARRLLADGLRPCTHCRPAICLNVIGLSDGFAPAYSPTPPERPRRCTPRSPTTDDRPDPSAPTCAWVTKSDPAPPASFSALHLNGQ